MRKKSGALAASFGVAAGTFALFFFGEVPRVRKDILQKVPFLDQYFDRTIAPEDNVSRIYQPIAKEKAGLTADIATALLSYLLRRTTFRSFSFVSRNVHDG